MDIGIAFICTNYNKYSFVALAGTIESSPATANTPLHFLDIRDEEIFRSDLQHLTRSCDRLIICFSFTTINLVKVSELIGKTKGWTAGGNVLFVAGGPHPSGDPVGVLKLGFDIVVIGEAEETFPEFIEAIGTGSDWRTIRGITYSDGNKLIKTGKREPVNLNKYAPFSPKHGKLSPIEISRGCPHACRFCQTSFLFGGRMRHRSLDDIIKYIRLGKANGMKDFRFISPNALAYGSDNGKAVNLEIIEQLLKKTSAITGTEHLFFGSFPSEVRPEAVSPEALALITTYTGTKQLVVGAQTGSQRMLDLLHREHTVGDVDHAVRTILAAGLEVSVDFIFGLPGETAEDRNLSISKINDLAGLGAKIHSHTFIPLPGTPLADEKPGTVDKDVSVHLGRLANKGLQFGQWQKQQSMAEQSLSLRAALTDC